MIREHAQAVIDLFATFPHDFYDGGVPGTPSYPYAVLYMDTGNDGATKLCGDSDLTEFRFQVTSVGLTAESARIVADAVRDAVLDMRLSVSGRSLGRIEKETSIPLQPDRQITDPETGLHPVYAVDRFYLDSHS